MRATTTMIDALETDYNLVLVGYEKTELHTRNKTAPFPKAVAAKSFRLAGTDWKRLFADATRVQVDSQEYQQMSLPHNQHGDGQVMAQIETH